MIRKTFSESESACEATFLRGGGRYWHAYTDGRRTELLFKDIEDYAFAMNVIAQAADVCNELKLMAFAVMSNHFHFVLSSESEGLVFDFFAFIRKRVSRSIPEIRSISLSVKPIDNLQSLRNNIVYTNRNGYVADPGHTPFSYPWGTGRYYFNDIPTYHLMSEIRTDARRLMFRGRAPALPGDWSVIDSYVAPSSYCTVKFGMAMFRDAHHYFAMVSKNVEAYSSVAADIDDEEFLTDTELFARLSAVIKARYQLTALRDLSKAQRLDLARTLHYDFRSSNGQIRRVLGLSQYEVNSLFPLSAK